ncbi:hypothetical protein SMICM304S_04241 [Streptomyces microflavus]
MRVNPGAACIWALSPPASSGIAIRRSESRDTRASWTSGRQRVTSSTRATAPLVMAANTGEGTRACSGPWASSSA